MPVEYHGGLQWDLSCLTFVNDLETVVERTGIGTADGTKVAGGGRGEKQSTRSVAEVPFRET